MTISEHAETFAGLPIQEYERDGGLKAPQLHAWLLTLGDDYYDAPEPLSGLIERFAAEKGADRVQAIVIGTFEEMAEKGGSDQTVKALVAAAARLTSLKALFFGDITYEECEISWIVQTSMAPLLQAYPRLEEFRVRGGTGLAFDKIQHATLRSLIIETGGLDSKIVRDVAAADLPALEHLELWLGDDNYGADWKLDDLRPILDGKAFPQLKVLGLRDSDRADEIATALATAPILERIHTLDLSLGTLGDQGADALLASPALKKLERIDLHHHYMSEAMARRFEALDIEVDLSDRQEGDEEDRFVAVGE
jgi:hypothetical protein